METAKVEGILRVSPMHGPLPPLRGFVAAKRTGRRLDCEQIDDAIRNRMQMRYGRRRNKGAPARFNPRDCFLIFRDSRHCAARHAE